MTLITQSEAARRLGISRQAVAAAVARGAIDPANRDLMAYQNAPAMFNPDEVERYRAESLRRYGRRRKATA
jgi:hypothetical protein